MPQRDRRPARHGPAAELADRLARNAEAVCRHYLSNGRREGRYWLVGDINNNPGRSLYVRLRGVETGSGAAGKRSEEPTSELPSLMRTPYAVFCLPKKISTKLTKTTKVYRNK